MEFLEIFFVNGVVFFASRTKQIHSTSLPSKTATCLRDVNDDAQFPGNKRNFIVESWILLHSDPL